VTRLILAVASVLGLAELAPARAQPPGGPFRSSASYAGGFGVSFGGPKVRVSGFSGGFVTRSVFAPPGFAPPFGPCGPVGCAPVGFGGPFFGGWGPGFGGYGPFGPPVVAVAVPVPVPVIVGGNPPDPLAVGANVPPPPRNDANPFPKLARPDDFFVIAPRRDAIPEVPRPADVRPVGPILFDPLRDPVRVEVPDADPKKEAQRLLKLGRESFAAGDYGRAAEHFERASTADPADAVTYFLHGQARFATGQFAEAAARIRDGLARDPKWPRARFDPIELYGDKPERFVLHLIALKKTVADNPGQVTLGFLLGYQLWFTGDKAEANRLFRAAEAGLPDPGPFALFKLP
jgi:hypothetical protein